MFNDSAAADLAATAGAPSAPGNNPEEEKEGAEHEQAETFFLPSGFPGSENLKPGDTVTLKVVGKDAEGGIEVEAESPEEGDEGGDWKEDLRSSMA